MSPGIELLFLPVTSTWRMRSLCSASLGMPLLNSNLSWSSSQFLRAVAITGSSVRVKSRFVKANPSPREAGVTKANP